MVIREKFDFAISSFSVLENQLADCMEYLPFIDENSQAISPKFVPIIIDACGLIDSIFFEISADKNTERFNLKKYSKIHESRLELDNNATLFLASPIRLLQPYKGWVAEQPKWWVAYNSLKHDRLNNFHFATFTNAIQALSGLHQLMVRQRDFVGGFLKNGWIDTTNFEVVENLGVAAYENLKVDVIVESKLFASASCENFINPDASDNLHFDVNYEANGLSNRIRNILFGHEESW
jgi:hypothetical protein